MSHTIYNQLRVAIDDLQADGLYKEERIITSPQQPMLRIDTGDTVINLCANNYLGLANHPELIAAAHQGLSTYGFGLSSVRFICGTQDIHKQLEARISAFLGQEDTILFSSCFDANTGLFETLLNQEDVIISDALNHASIIDGIRLCKADRKVYPNGDMQALEQHLIDAQQARYRLIATDGVFSMDGALAHLSTICDLAERYDALVMVDDSHAVGFMGAHGAGMPEHCGVMDRVDIITGTLGKALGGASGGYVAAKEPIITWLRQRSRPYLFSNSVAPVVVATTLAALDFIAAHPELRTQLHDNAHYFRTGLSELGFTLIPGEHPIIPIMLGDAVIATQMAQQLLKKGIYVVGFSYPVVPKGQARLRTQLSSAHTREQLDQALAGFASVGHSLGIIS